MTITGDMHIPVNLGGHPLKSRLSPQFFKADLVRQQKLLVGQQSEAVVDILLVNPPAPGEGLWRGNGLGSGRRSSYAQEMARPQVSLAQMAAMLATDYQVAVIDAVAQGLGWAEFEAILREKQPRYYLTQVRASTQQNDMLGAFLARGLGAWTIAFGAYVSSQTQETMTLYPNLDFVLRGEPELTLRELVDTLEMATGRRSETGTEPRGWARLQKIFEATNPDWQPAWRVEGDLNTQLRQVEGLAWRYKGGIAINPDRPFIPNLDDLPLAHHHLLPLRHYRMPLLKAPYAFVVANRNYPTNNGNGLQPHNNAPSVRVRSPENIMAELWLLHDLDIHHVHLRADVFTANREQVIGLCKMIIEEELPLRWSCTTYVDYVDEEVLTFMGRAGCWLISWTLEPATEQALKQAKNGHGLPQTRQLLHWARKAGIQNWGHFRIGLPGESEERIKETIALAKALPLDLALFHPAAAYPDSAHYFNPALNGRSHADNHRKAMGLAGEFDHEPLGPEALEYWRKRAFREWALRSDPRWTLPKGLKTWARFRSATNIGLLLPGWVSE